MKSIKQFLTVIFFFSLVNPLVSYADAIPAHFNGSYIGVDLGVGRGNASYRTYPNCGALGVNAVFCGVGFLVNGVAVSNSGTGKLSSNGFNGSVLVGHNWQTKNIVYGAEADIGTFKLHDSVINNGTFPFVFLGNQYTLTESISSNWLATVRGRFGAIINPKLLLYLTGGMAFKNYKFSSSYHDNATDVFFPGGTGSGSKSTARTGWTVGAGGEWPLTQNFSLKLEYLYMNFGSVNIAVPLSNTPSYTQTMRVKFGLNDNLVRLGINYRI